MSVIFNRDLLQIDINKSTLARCQNSIEDIFNNLENPLKLAKPFVSANDKCKS